MTTEIKIMAKDESGNEIPVTLTQSSEYKPEPIESEFHMDYDFTDFYFGEGLGSNLFNQEMIKQEILRCAHQMHHHTVTWLVLKDSQICIKTLTWDICDFLLCEKTFTLNELLKDYLEPDCYDPDDLKMLIKQLEESIEYAKELGGING